MLTLETFRALQTPDGQAALAAAHELELTEATTLRVLDMLRKTWLPDLAAAALETTVLRQRARAKFSRADAMYFTREALEQASGEVVARHRAARYADAQNLIFDICCGIGGDALGLATAGLRVSGIDRDPLRVAMAEANAQVYGVADRTTFRVGDALRFDLVDNALLFFDPARRRDTRSGRRRVFDASAYEPPLSLIEGWFDRAQGFGVKVAPGITYAALPYACEVEIVSVAGEVKEACLWFGSLRQHERTATLLDREGRASTLHWFRTPPIAVEPPHGWLYEPDGAVIRAHLVEQLATQIGAAKIDDEIAFLCSDTYTATPFARAWRIVEVLPWSLKRLRDRLREREVGSVVIKKRGSPVDPQELEQQLRLDRAQPNAIIVVLTRVAGKPSVILCEAGG